MNRSGERGHPCLVPDLSGKALSFCPLSMMLAVGLSYMAFIMLRNAPFIPTLLSVFLRNGCCILSNAFSASIDMIIQAPLVQTSTWLLTQPSLALSQESCSRPGARAQASVTLVPAWVPGSLLSLSTLLTVRSFNVLYLWSPIFIYAGIPLAVRSVPQIS